MNTIGSDFQQTVVKYVNFTIFDVSGQTGIWNTRLDYSRNIPKMVCMI